MTEAQARAELAAFVAVGEIERWIAEQRWEAVAGGWTAPEALRAVPPPRPERRSNSINRGVAR